MTFIYGLICGMWLGCVIFASICLAEIEAKRYLEKKQSIQETK